MYSDPLSRRRSSRRNPYNAPVPYSFGPFTLEPHTRRLLRGGDEIHLSPKAFDLLHCLIENRARAIPRAELHQRLWPDLPAAAFAERRPDLVRAEGGPPVRHGARF